MNRAILLAPALILVACASEEQAARGAPAAVLASETCRELFTTRATPAYPAAAMKDQVSGYAVVTYSLDGSGKARNVKVVESVPPGMFGSAAADALARSSFRPGVTRDGCRYIADFAAVHRKR